MSAPPSLTAGFAMAVQKVKGTAATTGYTLGRMTQSSLGERFDRQTADGEHRGTSGRPMTRQSRALNAGYIGQFSGAWRLYPDLIGVALQMSGFECLTEAKTTVTTAAMVQTITLSTVTDGTFTLTFMGETTAAVAHDVSNADLQTALIALSNLVTTDVVVSGTPGSSYVLTFGNTYLNKNVPLVVVDGSALIGGTASVALTTPAAGSYYVHTFTVAKRFVARWGTVLAAIDEGGNLWERKLTDARLSSLSINAGADGIVAAIAGLGLTLGAASGSETKVAETAYQLSRSAGAHSLKISTVEVGVTPRTHELIIAQDLADDDKALHTATRADIPIRGNGITGKLGGLDITYAVYKKMNWGGTSGTGPATAQAEAALDYNFISSQFVSGAVPYKIQIAAPVVQLTLSQPEASGNNLIRCEAEYTVLDLDTAEPITITLTNGIQHYCGS
jgi:hypothetical protein